jgi:hypothetical protein
MTSDPLTTHEAAYTALSEAIQLVLGEAEIKADIVIGLPPVEGIRVCAHALGLTDAAGLLIQLRKKYARQPGVGVDALLKEAM